MALQFVALDAQDATGATNTALIKAALLASNTGIQLPPGTFRVYATSGSVAPMPANKEIAGAPVAVGERPLTRLLLVGSDSTTAHVVYTAAAGIATGIVARNLEIDGGRLGGWATASYQGACVSYAGQGDYTGTPHNAQIVNCWLANGLTQQTSINSVYGLTMDHVVAWADADPVQGAHGCDFDAVANNKRSKFVTIVDCDLNAYGQESMKLENSTDFTISRTLFRQYVTLVQDVLPYDELGRITFSDCTFDADVTLDKLKITLGGGTGGDGSVTWNRCTFTADAMIYCNDSTVANYGTMTITDCVFSREGNSFAFPVGVTVVKSGNLNAELTPKRFARPELDPTTTGLYDPGTGPNAYMSRRKAPTNINSAVGVAVNGDEVWALDGTYVSAAGGANRSINCGGKTITLRAETKFGVVIDASGGSGWTGFNQSTDIAGHRVWGFVVYGAGIPGGNGAGAQVTGGDSYMYSMAFIGCKTANNGAGYRNTSTGTAVLEDFLIANCDGTTSTGGCGLYVSQAAPVGTVTLKRGRVVNNVVASTGVAGARLENANTTVDGLEVVGNVSTGGVGGLNITRAVTLNNFTAAGNVGGATAHDVSIANAITAAGDSWVCWSDNGTAVKAVNITSPSGVLNLDRATLRGGAAAVTGRPSYVGLTNIISTDPLFADAVGGNYQLLPASPSRGVGVQRAGMADAFNQPFAYDAASAHHGAWA